MKRAVDLVLAGLYVRTTEARRERLRAAARDAGDWGDGVASAEKHGVLGLLARNLRDAGVEAPDGVAERLGERVEALREDARRFRFTLERFVARASEHGVRTTLLKGASLHADVYPEPWLRGQGDVDLLVDPDDVERAVRAGAEAGLLPTPDAMPNWWYRRAHFHLKLGPTSTLLREVEIHWALHHPSLLLTPDFDALLARRTEVRVGDATALTLDRVDRFLHLATHLMSHARGAPGEPTRATLEALLTDPDHPLRLKWIVDVLAELDAWAAELPVESLVERAREWGAAGQTAWVVEWVRGALGVTEDADARVGELVERLRSAAALERAPREVGVKAQGDGPLDGFDFRADALSRLPGWFWPDAAYLERRYGRPGPSVRVAHASRVAWRVCAGALLLVPALLQRRLDAPKRRAAIERAASPDAVLDLAVAWRRSSRDGDAA